VTGITSRKSRQADLTQARASEIGNDLMHFGRPVPIAEKLDAVRAVTIEDIRRYLGAHPRDALSVLTLGPQALAS